jgi:hypothetical protein
MKLPHNGQKQPAEFFVVPERAKCLLDFNRLVTSSGPAQKYVIRRPLHAEGACRFCMAINQSPWLMDNTGTRPTRWEKIMLQRKI